MLISRLSVLTCVSLLSVLNCTKKKSSDGGGNSGGGGSPSPQSTQQQQPGTTSAPAVPGLPSLDGVSDPMLESLQSLAGNAYVRATQVRLDFKNTEAFQTKMNALETAKQTIDAAYFIYQDDFTSSAFSRKLLEKALAGVKVRLIVDGLSGAQYLQALNGLEKASNGNLKIALFRGNVTQLTQNPLNMSQLLNKSKRLHHKLIVVDQSLVIGGGRNIDDGYHMESQDPLFASSQSGGTPFLDADFKLANRDLALQAQSTFDAYWDCASNPGCAAKIEMNFLANLPAVGGASGSTMADRANAYANSSHAFQSPQEFKLEANEAHALYVENRMFHAGRSSEWSPELTEELSRYNQVIVRLIDTAKERIVLHNAYVFFTPQLFQALAGAMDRKVPITIVSNSEKTSDMPLTGKASRELYRAMQFHADKVGAPVRFFEHTSREMIHSKIWIFDKHLVIGSNNADPRSEVLDSQNGVVLGRSPHFIQNNQIVEYFADSYVMWLESRLADPNYAIALTRERLEKERPTLFSGGLSANPVELMLRSGQLFTLSKEAFLNTPSGANARKQLMSATMQL